MGVPGQGELEVAADEVLQADTRGGHAMGREGGVTA